MVVRSFRSRPAVHVGEAREAAVMAACIEQPASPAPVVGDEVLSSDFLLAGTQDTYALPAISFRVIVAFCRRLNLIGDGTTPVKTVSSK